MALAYIHDPIISIRDMFRGKNRLSPPEDAVDERLSHGKTGDVLTVLWKNRRCPQFCKCDISGSSLEPFIYIYIYQLKSAPVKGFILVFL